MRHIGKQGKRTAKAVERWKRTQKSNHQGYFECFYCHRWVDYLMAEHKNSKARHPEDRTNPENFVVTCAECNKKKGSKNATDFLL